MHFTQRKQYVEIRNKSEKDIDNQRITFTCIGPL